MGDGGDAAGGTGRSSRRGTVTRFDEERGLGAVTDEAGTELMFHCTVIADGSRKVAEGTRVVFEVVPGHLGRWEASAIRPDPAAGQERHREDRAREGQP